MSDFSAFSGPMKIGSDEAGADMDNPRTYRVTCTRADEDNVALQGPNVMFTRYTQRHFDRMDVRPKVGDVFDLTARGATLLGIVLIGRGDVAPQKDTEDDR